MPAEEASAWLSEGPHEMVHFYLSAALLGELAAEIYGVDAERVELREAGFHLDESLARYAMTMRERLNEPEPVTGIELNSIAQLLGVHLLRHYSNLAPRPVSRVDQPMSPAQLRAVNDYVAANLDGALRLHDLAAAVGMNPYRFARSFQVSTGDSPHRCIAKIRLARAAICSPRAS